MTNIQIISSSVHFMTNERWTNAHFEAWRSPRTKSEYAIKYAILSFAAMADASLESGTPIGQDGYFGEHARAMVEAMLAYLNFDIGRFDAGTLDRLIRDLAANNGVELPK